MDSSIMKMMTVMVEQETKTFSRAFAFVYAPPLAGSNLLYGFPFLKS